MVTNSRTHEEFMADQIKYEQKRFDKLKQVLEKEEEEISKNKPVLNKKTHAILSKKQ
jgi:hypothetical protein